MKRRVHRRPSERQAHVEAFLRSDLSAAAYCRQHRISKSSLYLWQSKSTTAPRFVAVPLSAPATPARAEMATPAAPLRLIIGEVRVEFAAETPIPVIASLLAALGREAAQPGHA